MWIIQETATDTTEYPDRPVQLAKSSNNPPMTNELIHIRKLVIGLVFGQDKFVSHDFFEIFHVSVVTVLKCIDTLCRDDFRWERVPGIDDSVSEVVRSAWTILCELASYSLAVASGATRWSASSK